MYSFSVVKDHSVVKDPLMALCTISGVVLNSIVLHTEIPSHGASITIHSKYGLIVFGFHGDGQLFIAKP